jgi:hypothetical protein
MPLKLTPFIIIPNSSLEILNQDGNVVGTFMTEDGIRLLSLVTEDYLQKDNQRVKSEAIERIRNA